MGEIRCVLLNIMIRIQSVRLICLANRVYKEAQLIRSEPGWWFNEPMDLPPLMKEKYKKFMDEQNAKLTAMGEPVEKEWAR